MKKVIISIFLSMFMFNMEGQILIFDNFNTGGVMNGPTVATTFTTNSSWLVQSIQTYHWNSGKGANPGSISLRNSAGVNIGTWTATGSPASGISNIFWTVSPKVVITAGSYTIIVSNNATWSYNSSSQNKGFAKVSASLIPNRTTQTPPDDDKGVVGPLSTSSKTPVSIMDNFNGGGVINGPTAQATFTTNKPYTITTIQTYHWNSAKGAAPGSISLRNSAGVTYGPWTATGSPASGIPNVFWTVAPNAAIPAGTYTVIVSNTGTWSHNSTSQNKGFVKVFGY